LAELASRRHTRRPLCEIRSSLRIPRAVCRHQRTFEGRESNAASQTRSAPSEPAGAPSGRSKPSFVNARLSLNLLRALAALAFVGACAHPARQATAVPVPPASTSESPASKTTTDSTREYTGEWETGFETSVFRGCNGSTPAKIWVSLAPGASASARWSDNNLGAGATARTYYVRVRGILRGPAPRRKIGDGYGHLGGFDYELYVTRVMEVKPPGEPNCVVRR